MPNRNVDIEQNIKKICAAYIEIDPGCTIVAPHKYKRIMKWAEGIKNIGFDRYYDGDSLLVQRSSMNPFLEMSTHCGFEVPNV